MVCRSVMTTMLLIVNANPSTSTVTPITIGDVVFAATK